MNIASIDIGSNTVLLLIAEYNSETGEIKSLRNEYRMPRIGRGLIKGQPIPESSIAKMFKVLDEYKQIAENYSCQKFLVTGTNALRIASNRDEIINSLRNKFSFDLKVISGDEEAKFAFLGSTEGLNTDLPILVIDIGGGSTELILGNENDIIYSESFPFGAVNLTENFINDDRHSISQSIQRMQEFIQVQIEKVIRKIPDEFLTAAVAGTPTSLSCIKQNLKIYDDKKVERSILNFDFLESMINEFSKKSPKNILTDYGSVVEGREDIILAGTTILAEICRTLNIDEVIVSSKGIRYGAIVNYVNQIQKGK
jgi:exopolyphosphatase/guanosine-5'-triphosphate,3'-diphosphate pyrophosphatase